MIPFGLARFVAIAAASALASCGWRAGLEPPEGVRTIGVEVFANDSPLRDLELAFTDEMTQSIAELLHARLVPPDRADLVVRGRIVDYRRRGGIRSRENQILESGARVIVAAHWMDRRTGHRFPPEPDEDVVAGIWSGYLVGESAEERAARARALRFVADQLVLDLFASLPYKETP